MARDFGLAIQSIGMTSALLFIVMRGIPVERRMLTWSCIGAVIGLTLGTYLLAGRVPADWVKLLFATLWITFGGWLVTGTAKATSEPGRRPRQPTSWVWVDRGRRRRRGCVPDWCRRRDARLRNARAAVWMGAQSRGADGGVCHGPGVAGRPAAPGDHVGHSPGGLPHLDGMRADRDLRRAGRRIYLDADARRVLLGIIGVLVLVQFAVTVNQVRPSAALWGGVLALAALSGAGLWLLAPSAPERTERQTGDIRLG
jgi:hypothetical protein